MSSFCLVSLPLMMENTRTPPCLHCLVLYRPDCFGDKKLTKMSLQFCLTPQELAQASQFSPVKSVSGLEFFPWLRSSDSSVEISSAVP